MNSTHTDKQADLARLFQAQYADFTDDIPFFLESARRHGGPILELGCGTGRVLLELASTGFQTVGVDHNPAMLSRIDMRHAPDSPIRLVVADLEALPFDGPFRLIISPCSTIGYLDQAALARCLDSIRRLIALDGRLVMDLPSPHQPPLENEAIDPLEWFHEPNRGTDVQVSADQRLIDASLVDIDWHYDEMLADGHVQRHSFRRRYHLRDLTEMESILKLTGFSIEDAFGDYQRAAFSADSAGFLLVAKPQ